MRSLLFCCGTRDLTASGGLLLLRIGFGALMLIGHGFPKLQNFEKLSSKFYTPDFFPLQWMSSTVSLSACIAAELGTAALIILGLATRPAAFLLGFAMVVAAFGTLAQAPWFVGPGVSSAKEPALLYLLAMAGLILAGAGRFSLDALIDKQRRGRMKIAL